MPEPATHPFADRWNHNTHYFPLLRATLPDATTRLLDIGCGDGTFCRFAAAPSRLVVGLDLDARLMAADDGVRYVVGSAESLGFADATFDAVTLSMVVHHVDPALALPEAARVLRPGGLLQVLGIGRFGGARDIPHEVRDAVSHRLLARRLRHWEPDTVKQDPGETWAEALATARRLLPGCSWDRLPLWRYRVTWTKPGARGSHPC
jgi:SAM-dependent methyltransferase